MRSFSVGILAAILCIGVVPSVTAQVQKGIPSDGRDFYLAEVMPSIKCAAIKPFQGFFLLISSYYDCNVTVSYFDGNQGGKEIQGSTVHIAAKRSAQVALDQTFMDPRDANGGPLNPDGEVPMYTACHVHADRPVSITYYSTGPNSGGLYLALQTGALGKKYVVASLPANPSIGHANSHHFPCTPDSSSSEFCIIAIKDDTHVTITPNGTTRMGHPGVSFGPGSDGHPHPFTVNLRRGHVFWVKSPLDDAENDMSGSLVEADQPVAVIAGNEGAYNGQTIVAGNGGDQRDMSCEEMVPVEYWTSDGYVSMPFMDSPGGQPEDPSAGDEFKVFTYDPQGTVLNANIGGLGIRNPNCVRFGTPVTFDNVQQGINVASQNGTKIFVEQYDYRAQNSGEPYTAPSQMNIIPLDRFRTSYMWSVPDDKSQVHKRRYINVIANRTQWQNIKVQYNAGSPKPITSLTAAGSTANIPGHPELQGRRYEIFPGAYFATCDSAFALYQYGDLGLDPDFDLGDNDDDDYYFSYASICGQSFGIDGAGNPTVKVDTLCDGWHVHVTDTLQLDGGISQVELLKDPSGVLKRKPNTDSGYVSTNCDFDPFNFTVVPGVDSTDFKIIVDDPLQDAEAWLWVLNVAGNDTLLHLIYHAPQLTFTGSSGANFPNRPVGTDTCTQFVFKNTGTSGRFTVSSYSFSVGGQQFSVSGTVPPLPVDIGPGDSVVFNVCFHAKDAATVYKDTLIIQTNCPTPRAPLLGSTNVGEINAEDHDFGKVLVGHTSCYGIKVWNSGKAEFTLTKQWVLDNFADFTFEDTAKLPVIIHPGETKTFQFCFSPSAVGPDTATQHWGSDLPDPFTHVKKDFSGLKGEGIAPLLVWDTNYVGTQTICDSVLTVRRSLINHGTASLTVDTVEIVGPDAAEFKIIGNQDGYVPLNPMTTPFPMSPGSSIWVDVQFTPDLSKPDGNGPGQRWGDRANDSLVALDDQGIHPIVTFNINVYHAEVTLSNKVIDLGSTSVGKGTGTKTITVTNTGRGAPLIIDSIGIDPRFKIEPGSLKLWDTIQPGKSETITFSAVGDKNGLDTGFFFIRGMTQCSGDGGMLIMSISDVGAEGTDENFGNTYMCLNNQQMLKAYGQGFRSARLDSIQIIDDPQFPGQSKEFAFADGTQTIRFTKQDLPQGDTLTIPVSYSPQQKANATAKVIYYFDTAGNPGVGPFTKTHTLQGSGLQEYTVLSAANQAGGPYIAKTASTFDVPIRMTRPIATTARITSVAFDLTFDQDLFREYANDPVMGPIKPMAGYTVLSWSTSASNHMEHLHVVMGKLGGGVFSPSEDIGHVMLQLMITRDTVSNFVISNVEFRDSTNNAVCYVLHDTIPGSFTPQDFCGDKSLRLFVQTGLPIFGIKDVHPNPATNAIHVNLDVNRDQVPMSISLYNTLGENVRNYTDGLPMFAGNRNMDLDLSGLPSGTYSLRIATPGQNSTRMILIQK